MKQGFAGLKMHQNKKNLIEKKQLIFHFTWSPSLTDFTLVLAATSLLDIRA
jgi:hypothetical protein